MTDFVVLKLVSGENILTALEMEFEESVLISFPLLLKNIPILKNGSVYERLATSEFCPYTDEKRFDIKRKDIIYMKPMKKTVATMYQQALQDMYIMPHDQLEQEDHDEVEEDKKNYH